MTLSRRSLLAAIAAAVVVPLGLSAPQSIAGVLLPERLEFDSDGRADLLGEFAELDFGEMSRMTNSINDDWFMGHAPGTLFVSGYSGDRAASGKWLVRASLLLGVDAPPSGLSLTTEQWRRVHNHEKFGQSTLAAMRPV